MLGRTRTRRTSARESDPIRSSARTALGPSTERRSGCCCSSAESWPNLGALPDGESTPSELLNRGFAEQVPDLGEEVGLRVDAVLRAELEEFRADRRDDVDVDRRFAREVADDARELADHPGAGGARVDLQTHLAPLRVRLERRDLERDELRLAL